MVTFYDIDDNGEPTVPVLYLDTLKVSTIETTAENTSARGGKGNAELIMWDYGKEITVTLEDALFSAKSMAVMFGDSDGIDEDATSIKIKKTWNIAGKTTEPETYSHGGETFEKSEITGLTYYKLDEKGNAVSCDTTWEKDVVYATGTLIVKHGRKIEINAETFPGTYYITGDTYSRSETTGKDDFFQFIIRKAKVLSEVTLTMEADGDPSTFSMNLKVLRPKSGPMMELVQYDFNEEKTETESSGDNE